MVLQDFGLVDLLEDPELRIDPVARVEGGAVSDAQVVEAARESHGARAACFVGVGDDSVVRVALSASSRNNLQDLG